MNGIIFSTEKREEVATVRCRYDEKIIAKFYSGYDASVYWKNIVRKDLNLEMVVYMEPEEWKSML